MWVVALVGQMAFLARAQSSFELAPAALDGCSVHPAQRLRLHALRSTPWTFGPPKHTEESKTVIMRLERGLRHLVLVVLVLCLCAHVDHTHSR